MKMEKRKKEKKVGLEKQKREKRRKKKGEDKLSGQRLNKSSPKRKKRR